MSNLEQAKAIVQTLEQQEFRQFMWWASTDEETRRNAAPLVEQEKSKTLTEVSKKIAEEHPELFTPAQSDGVQDWAPWEPADGGTHYYYGKVVTHGGKQWRNVNDPTGTTLNVWEPGAPGIDERYWVEVTGQDEESGDSGDSAVVGDSEESGETVPEWTPGKAVLAGEFFTYEGDTYRVIQGHTLAEGWKPDREAALYEKVVR